MQRSSPRNSPRQPPRSAPNLTRIGLASSPGAKSGLTIDDEALTIDLETLTVDAV